jgi:hypothetical protein
MAPFCPDGYVRAQEAIERAARYWFAQQITALETALTPVEKLARALEPPPLISEGLRQHVMHLLIQTEHRLRNFLHQGDFFDRGLGRCSDERKCAHEQIQS